MYVSCGACGAPGLLQGGVGGKHRAAQQRALVNVQYSIDEHICAAYATMHAHECIHRVHQYVCLPATINTVVTITGELAVL